MPFNLRNFEEEAKAKMGVVECVAHKLIEPFQVLYEKKGNDMVGIMAQLVKKIVVLQGRADVSFVYPEFESPLRHDK